MAQDIDWGRTFFQSNQMGKSFDETDSDLTCSLLSAAPSFCGAHVDRA